MSALGIVLEILPVNNQASLLNLQAFLVGLFAID